jgi:hypothetical protein
LVSVHAHAAAAIINFCTGVDGNTLQPYLDPIVEGLLTMLNAHSKRYVQEQAITTLAMVADAAADTFRKVSIASSLRLIITYSWTLVLSTHYAKSHQCFADCDGSRNAPTKMQGHGVCGTHW